MEQKQIFISHSSPHDNYFAAWLASKLKLLGFTVWIELDELTGGEAFWIEIEKQIRNNSCKFLAIISDSFLEKSKDSNSGVFKELSCADRVKGIPNFKVPIKLSEISEDDFPMQLMGLNSISFVDNWKTGLDKLLDSFKKENIERNETMAENPLNFWLDSLKVEQQLNNLSEKIYTNWLAFEIPEKLYIHKPIISTKLDLIDILFPFIEYSDRHICFFPKEDYPNSIEVTSSYDFEVTKIIEEKMVPVDDSIILNLPKKKIVELINKTFEHHLIQKGLKKFPMSNSSMFYYPYTPTNSKRISLKLLNKTNVSVTGKNKNKFWSFGITHFSYLEPLKYLKISSHITFEDEHFNVLNDDDMHALRRKFGFDWYNKDWLDTLLGFLLRLSGFDQDFKIKIPVSSSTLFSVDVIPINIDSNFGYYEPEKNQNEDD